MGLFSKKEPCCLCGNPQVKEKLSDGWICNDCINKSGGFLSYGEKFKDVSKEKVIKCTENNIKNLELLKLFLPTKKIKEYLYIDAAKRQWLVPSKIKAPIVLSYDDIIGVNVQQNGNNVTKSDMTGAVTGGILFGAPGAVIGATMGKKTTKEVITSLNIIITTKNPLMPRAYILLLNGTTVTEGTTAYNYLKLDLESLLSEFSIMKADADAKQQNTNNTLSIPDEIVKYKKLCDDGIITQEEFEAKKKQLLEL